MGGLFNDGIFGGNRGRSQPSTGLGGMMVGRGANVPGIRSYDPGLDPAVAAAQNVWGAQPGMDPAQIAATNVWGPNPGQPGGGPGPTGMFDVGGALYSPYKGHADRMSHKSGYKTRHMLRGGDRD